MDLLVQLLSESNTHRGTVLFTGINSMQPHIVFINQRLELQHKTKADYGDKHFCSREKHIFQPKNDVKVVIQILP